MKHLSSIILLFVLALPAPIACTAVQRAEVATAVRRTVPKLREALRYVGAILGLLPPSGGVTTARVLASAASGILDVSEATESATAACRGWVAVYATLEHSVTVIEQTPNAPEQVRLYAKRATATVFEAMPANCRDAELALGPESTPGTESSDAGGVGDAGGVVQSAVIEDNASRASVRRASDASAD